MALGTSITFRIAAALCVIAAVHASYKLTVLHTNDVHARFDEAHKYGGMCSPEDAANGDCVGGISRRYIIASDIPDTWLYQ